MISEALKTADRVLLEAASRLRLVAAVRPLNEAEEKNLFLAGRSRSPNFRYPERPTVRIEPLKTLKIPSTPLGRILDAQRLRLLKLESTLNSKHTDFRPLSREIYGAPSPGLQSTALSILRRLPAVPSEEETLDLVRAALEKALVRFGLPDWQIETASGDFTAARALERKIMLTNVGPVSQGTAQRLAVHEVGVHALRANNGFSQPLSIFGYGLPGYERTEEGLATYAEVVTGTTDARVLRNYAARAVAVIGLDKGWGFRQCYEELRGLGQPELPAWEATLRAHRGGGFFKDHIYLDGLLDVTRYVTDGGDLGPLFAGKVGLEHLGLIQEATDEGHLIPPPLVPDFFYDATPSSEVWDLLKSLVGVA